MSKGHINNNYIKILFIPSIFIVLTLLEFSCVDVIFGEEVITTIPVGDSPIGLTFNPFNNNMYIANAESDTVSVIGSESLEKIATIPVGDLSLVSVDSPMEFNPFNRDIYVANEGSNTVSVINSITNNVTFQDNNNVEFGTNLNSTIFNVDIPLMPLSLTPLTMGYVTNDANNNMKSSNKETDLANHINNNPYKVEDTLTGLGNNSINNLDHVSFKEPEKIVIQHNPETDDVVVDPTPTSLILEVAQQESLENTTIAEAQCLMCADLALLQSGGQSQQETVSDALIGNSTNNNIFPVCASDTPQTGFNATIDATSLNVNQTATVKNAFAECLTNAPDFVPIVVETTLLAEDGNEDPITDGDSTTSNDIEFTFNGTTNAPAEFVTARGFECTLVEEPGGDPVMIIENCGDPVTGVNPFMGSEEFTLPPGTYTFEVADFYCY